MDISIILVNYNTKSLTRNCLNSIFHHTKGIEFEVFVVDNASEDESVKMIEDEFPQVKLIKNKENLGFGAANNIAIKRSKAKYIFCLNTDTVLMSNSVKDFFDFMEKEENKNIAACGCQLLDKDLQLQHSGGNLPSFFRILTTLFGINLFFPKWYNKKFINIHGYNTKTPYEIGFITGADLFIRKDVLDKIGYFDETFFMYYEDSELQYRIHRIGLKTVIIPNIKIIHYCGIPNKDIPINKFKTMRKSELLYFEKCYNKFTSKMVKYLYLIRSILNVGNGKKYFEHIKMHFEL